MSRHVHDPNIEKLRKSLQGANETPPRPSVQMDGRLYYSNNGGDTGAKHADQWNKIHYHQLENVELHMQKIQDRLGDIIIGDANLYDRQDIILGNQFMILDKLNDIQAKLTVSNDTPRRHESPHDFEFFSSMDSFNFGDHPAAESKKCEIEDISAEVLSTPSPISADDASSSDPYRSAIEHLRDDSGSGSSDDMINSVILAEEPHNNDMINSVILAEEPHNDGSLVETNLVAESPKGTNLVVESPTGHNPVAESPKGTNLVAESPKGTNLVAEDNAESPTESHFITADDALKLSQMTESGELLDLHERAELAHVMDNILSDSMTGTGSSDNAGSDNSDPAEEPVVAKRSRGGRAKKPAASKKTTTRAKKSKKT